MADRVDPIRNPRPETSVGSPHCALSGAAVVLLLGLWMNHVGRGDVFGWDLPSGAWTLFYAGRVVVPVLFVIAWRRIDASWGRLIVVGSAALLLGTSLCPAAPYGLRLWPLGLVVCGVGYSLASFSCYVLLARTCAQRACVYSVAAGFGAKALLSAALGLADPSLAAPVSVVVPWALVLATAVFLRFSEKAAPVPRQPLAASGRRFLCTLILLASCVLFILTTTSQIGLAGGSGMYSVGATGRHIGLGETAVSLAVYAVLSRTVLASQLENSLTARYLPSFATLAFGMVLSVAASLAPDDLLGAAVHATLNGVEFFGHLLMWSIVMDVARVETPFTARHLAFCAFGESLALTGSIVSPNGEPLSAAAALVVLTLGFALVTAVTAVLPSLASGRALAAAPRSHKYNKSTGGSATTGLEGGEALSNALSLRCESMAERCGLTPREQEVFLLLCQGRNRNVVAEMLGLSLNTVKTHVGRIYTKLGVNSHQELLDVLYGGKPETYSERADS